MATPGLTFDNGGSLPPGTTFGDSSQLPGMGTTSPTAQPAGMNFQDIMNAINASSNSNTINNPMNQYIQDALASITANNNNSNAAMQAALSAKSQNQPIVLDPALFKTPDFNKYLTDAMNNPALIDYYKRLLTESQGDVNLAKSRITEDYGRNVGIIGQQAQLGTTRAGQDLTSSMQALGLQFPKEQQTLLDTLNKRGIALTEGDPGTPLKAATEGRAGYETSQLSQDQALRQEAVQRTANRSIEDIGIKQKQATQQEQITQQRGTEDQNITARKEAEALQQQKEDKGFQAAQMAQQSDLATQQMNLQKAIAKSQGASV